MSELKPESARFVIGLAIAAALSFCGYVTMSLHNMNATLSRTEERLANAIESSREQRRDIADRLTRLEARK